LSTQPESAPGEGSTAAKYLRPLRDLAALILVAAPAVMLFVAVIRLIPSGDGDQFSTRAQESFGGFVNLTSIGLPLLAVLLSTLIRPEHPRAKLITTVALVQYAVIAFFGVLFGFLVGLISIAGWSVRLAFEEFLVRGAWLAVFGIAAFAVFQIWRNLYYTPRPQPVPGMYGQPTSQHFGPPPGAPQHGGPPQYGAPQQPGPQQPGPQQYNAPQQYGQPAQQQYGRPAWNQTGPGQPPPPYATQTFGEPQPAPQSGPPAPHSGPPVQQSAQQSAQQPPGPFAPEPGHPQGAAPYGSPSFGSAPYAAPTSGAHGDAVYGAAPGYGPRPDATQVVPPGEHERTQMINPDRPGYEEQDPYRR
jgi:hypothetical protein